MMMSNATRNGLILSAFAIITTALIGFTYIVTKESIEEQRLNLLRHSIQTVLPTQHYDNNIVRNCAFVANETLHATERQRIYRGYKNDQPHALVIETTAPNGYSGNIHMLMGVLIDGTVTGVSVLDHKETPGLGDKIDRRISDWILSFNGEKVSRGSAPRWDVKKNGGAFDQFTGATITPRAVVKQIEASVLTMHENWQQWFVLEDSCEPLGDEQ